jgi:haloacetate dehalogenase
MSGELFPACQGIHTFEWFFYARPELAERVISADPVAWYRPDAQQTREQNFAELIKVINNSETVRAMLENYRAG